MQRIITSYCWSCEEELYYAIGSKAFCGTTHFKCSNCGSWNKTNNKPYSRMTSSEIISAIFNNFVLDIGFILPLSIFAIFGLSIGFDSNISLGSAFVFVVYNGYKFIILKNLILESEIEQKKIDELLNNIEK